MEVREDLFRPRRSHSSSLGELSVRRLWEAPGRLKSVDHEAPDAFYTRGHSLLAIAEELGVTLVPSRGGCTQHASGSRSKGSVADCREWTDGLADDSDRSSTSRSEWGPARGRCGNQLRVSMPPELLGMIGPGAPPRDP
jgi:hypothetical protein